MIENPSWPRFPHFHACSHTHMPRSPVNSFFACALQKRKDVKNDCPFQTHVVDHARTSNVISSLSMRSMQKKKTQQNRYTKNKKTKPNMNSAGCHHPSGSPPQRVSSPIHTMSFRIWLKRRSTGFARCSGDEIVWAESLESRSNDCLVANRSRGQRDLFPTMIKEPDHPWSDPLPKDKRNAPRRRFPRSTKADFHPLPSVRAARASVLSFRRFFQNRQERGSWGTSTGEVPVWGGVVLSTAPGEPSAVTAAGIAWVGKRRLLRRWLRTCSRVSRTGVSHQDLFQFHFMPAKRRARIDGVRIVEAAAHGIALDDFDAHDCSTLVVPSADIWRSRSWSERGLSVENVWFFSYVV
jgi:hypothetical protein